MKTINQTLYILAGVEGKVFKSNGAVVQQIAQIPSSICDLTGGKILTTYPSAVAKYKGRFFFGIGTSTAAGTNGCGVWSVIETASGNLLTLEHGISQEDYGSANNLEITSLLPVTNEELLIGWNDDATTYGIDKTTISGNLYSYATPYTNCYWDSAFFTVGTHLKKRTFTQLEFQLAKDIADNEGIKISYRLALDDTFTEIGTYTNTGNAPGKFEGTSHHDTLNIPACEFVQIRCSLTGVATTPQIKSVILR